MGYSFLILLRNKKRFARWSIQVLFRKDCQHKHTLCQSLPVSARRLFGSGAATISVNIPSADVRKKLCMKLGTRQGGQLSSNTWVEDATRQTHGKDDTGTAFPWEVSPVHSKVFCFFFSPQLAEGRVPPNDSGVTFSEIF